MAYNNNCSLSSGWSIPCKGMAGIQEIYVGSWNSTALTYTLGTGSNLNQITAFTGVTTSFFRIQQPIETGSISLTGNFNDTNGVAVYDQVAEVTLTGTNQVLADLVNTLGRGKWRIIVLDSNGYYFLLGKTNPVTVTGVAGGLGKAYTDLNGYTITFTGKEYDNLQQVTTSAAIAVISNL